MIERLLEDPSFHQSLLQILLEQWQPCAVATLPAVNIGAIAAVPAVLYVGSDDDPEKSGQKNTKGLKPFHCVMNHTLSSLIIHWTAVYWILMM